MPPDFRPAKNVNASAPGGDPWADVAVQSETSMVRIDRDGGSRFMVAYNDNTNTTEAVPDGGSRFEFVGIGSVMGWSTSAGDVLSWTRHDQLAFPTDGGMLPLGGDPRLAAFGRLVFYTGMTFSAPLSLAFDGVVLGRYDDNSQQFDPLIQVAKGNESDKADFFPCPSAKKSAGDYISGVFQEPNPMSQSVTVAWTDSRKGCANQGNLSTLTHQHVYVGSGHP